MIQLCKRFNLKFGGLRFSRILTEKELNAYNLFLSKRLEREILSRYDNDYIKADKEVKRWLNGTGYTGNIDKDAKKRIRIAILNVKHNKKDKITNYLRHNKKLFNLLLEVYKKIDKNPNLVDTTPIPIPEGFLSILRARLHSGEIFKTMVHECTHRILQYNSIDYSPKSGGGQDMRDEGLCQFLHKRFGRSYHPAKEYEKFEAFFEQFFKDVPDNKIISLLRKYSPDDLLKMMKNFLKENS